MNKDHRHCIICKQSLISSYEEEIPYQCTECIQQKIIDKSKSIHILLQQQQQSLQQYNTSTPHLQRKEQIIQRIQLLKDEVSKLKQTHMDQTIQNKQLQKELNVKQNELSKSISVLKTVQSSNTKLQQNNSLSSSEQKLNDKLRKRRRKNCEFIMETIPIFIDKYSKDSNKLPQKLYILNHQFWIPLFDDLWLSAKMESIHDVQLQQQQPSLQQQSSSFSSLQQQQQQQQEILYCDAEMISNALGYIVLIVKGLSVALQIELPHSMNYLGSKSTISDQSVSYPLFVKGVKREEFVTAIQFLNFNVNYLCSQLGIVVAIPNLNNFRVNLLCLYLYQHEVCSQMGPFQFGEQKYTLLDNYMVVNDENRSIKELPVLLHPLFAEKQQMKYGHLLSQQPTHVLPITNLEKNSLLSKYIKEEYL